MTNLGKKRKTNTEWNMFDTESVIPMWDIYSKS